MLRRAENVGLAFTPGFFTRKGWLIVTIGRNSYRVRKIHQDQFNEAVNRQRAFPVFVIRVGERSYWHFQDRFYWDNDGLSAEQVHALLVTRQQREKQRIDRAMAMVAMDLQPRSQPRGAIPDDVKQFVWARDQGRCRHCGSTVELQFDHIIPVSMGGGSAPENLQILCGPCNRRKSSGLTIR
ncbi:HNH endonuclease [Microtetraspora malaysiensis]|uniref:HNH endonuclease n=1 Tax=Microtetraspora malaysiensis TaxID=161358 RepID=UPI003D93C025